MMDYDRDQKFLELCAMGDLESIKNFYEKNTPDVNSQNKVNKWTALHWAVQRNHSNVVKYLIEIGASNEILNSDMKRPSDIAKNESIKRLLNDHNQCVSTEESHTYTPNYLKYPQFPYTDSKYVEYESKLETKNVIKNNEVIKHESKPQIVVIRVKTQLDSDFVEIDIDVESTTFDEFKKLCLHELNLPRDIEVIKIKKHQNVLIRNDKDIKRLKNDIEVELFV